MLAPKGSTVIVANVEVRWRASGMYLPNNSSKAGLLEETRTFLLAYGRLGNVDAARQVLLNGELSQRSRVTRANILRTLQERLTRWRPPAWVLNDLAAAAEYPDRIALKAELLLHVPRQDCLLYDFVHEYIVPRWRGGELELARSDAQRFLDQQESAHPEITSWGHQTREKLTGNMLTILRDYGLLRGKARKRLVEPIVPAEAVRHLVGLLRDEGIAEAEIPRHPDWQLWLWDSDRVHKAIAQLYVGEETV